MIGLQMTNDNACGPDCKCKKDEQEKVKVKPPQTGTIFRGAGVNKTKGGGK